MSRVLEGDGVPFFALVMAAMTKWFSLKAFTIIRVLWNPQFWRRFGDALNNKRPQTGGRRHQLNRKSDQKEVLGISFLRAKTQPVGDFVEFLRQRGHLVQQTKVTVSISAIPGNLEEMAQKVHDLAREFDQLHGTLVANTLAWVWEYRNCCVNSGCCDRPRVWADVYASSEWVSTGQWKESEGFESHLRLVQTFVLSEDPTSKAH